MEHVCIELVHVYTEQVKVEMDTDLHLGKSKCPVTCY